jgi:hypothetical protein
LVRSLVMVSCHRLIHTLQGNDTPSDDSSKWYLGMYHSPASI